MKNLQLEQNPSLTDNPVLKELEDYTYKKKLLAERSLQTLDLLEKELSGDLSDNEIHFISDYFLDFEYHLTKNLLEENVELIFLDFTVQKIKELDCIPLKSFSDKNLSKDEVIEVYFIHEKKSSSFFINQSNLKIFAHLYLVFIHNKNIIQKKVDGLKVSRIFEQFFNQINIPVIIFNKQLELLFHNRSFRDLNILSKSLLDEKSDHLIIGRYSYRIDKYEPCDTEKIIYSLIKKENATYDAHDEELGIITSSIAHELNNPIAGIMLGVETILSLSDDLTIDLKEILSEVKSSSDKTKSLIHTFLGFYRDYYSEDTSDLFSTSIEQGLSFVRSRMIETDLILNLNLQKIDAFKSSEKTIWTMSFYIIFTSVINALLRKQLISRKLQKRVEVKIEASGKGFTFSFEDKEVLSHLFEDLNLSSFFHYLLGRDEMIMELINKESIVFSRRLVI